MNTKSELTPKTIRASFEMWLGAADDVVEFHHASPDEAVPTDLGVLFFLPEKGPKEDNVSTVATAGMATRLMNSKYNRVELAFEIKGTVEKGNRHLIAKQLAELAVIPFLEARPFRPNLILENVHLFPFDNLTCMLLAHWEIVGELFLPNLTPPVLILRIIPLFPPEAALAEQLGDVRVLSQLRNKGLVYEDFERKSLVH